jgi:hypothetical protein
MQIGARKKKSAEKPFGRLLAAEPGKPRAVIHKTCG